MPEPTTIVQAAALWREDPALPVLTCYDGSVAARTELSCATLSNWVAKTANLLVDDLDARPGQPAVVLLPPHWQSAGVVLGCLAAGLVVDAPPVPRDDDAQTRDDDGQGSGVGADGGLGPAASDAGPGGVAAVGSGPVLVAFCSRSGAARARSFDAEEVFAVSLTPFGLALAEPPPGTTDYAGAVRTGGDRFTLAADLLPTDPAMRTGRAVLEHGALFRRLSSRARQLGLGSDDRVLVNGSAVPDVIDWLLTPIAAGATLVLVTDPRPETDWQAVAGTEEVTASWGMDIVGLPRLS